MCDRSLQLALDSPTITKFEWLGLFSDKQIPAKVTTSLDAVCALMEEKMQYATGEKDMILMKHIFEVSGPALSCLVLKTNTFACRSVTRTPSARPSLQRSSTTASSPTASVR
jgi:hypothetical protein